MRTISTSEARTHFSALLDEVTPRRDNRYHHTRAPGGPVDAAGSAQPSRWCCRGQDPPRPAPARWLGDDRGHSSDAERRAAMKALFAKRRSRNSSITPPLRGSRRSPSRMAKASAEGGSHKASQRRDLVRRRGYARANLQAKADAVAGDRDLPGQRQREDVARGGVAFTRPQCDAAVHSRDAASAPLRIDCGLRPRPLRLPLKGGGVILER